LAAGARLGRKHQAKIRTGAVEAIGESAKSQHFPNGGGVEPYASPSGQRRRQGEGQPLRKALSPSGAKPGDGKG